MKSIKKLISSYGITSIISYIIRNSILPNPFECFGKNAFWINLIADPIIHIVAYFITGMFYKRNSFPTLGSILYCVFYCAIIFALWLLSLVKFVWWSIVLAIIVTAIIGYLIFMACQMKEDCE